jgi:hypothetical protein
MNQEAVTPQQPRVYYRILAQLKHEDPALYQVVLDEIGADPEEVKARLPAYEPGN